MAATSPKHFSLSLPAWPPTRYLPCLSPSFFQPISSFRLFLSYFWLVSTFPWRRQSQIHSLYLTLQGFSRPSQQVSFKSLFAHCLLAGGRKRHKNYGYNDCCYNDYGDYRRRRRRSALERGPLLDTLEDRGGYRKVRQNGTQCHTGAEEEMQEKE